MIVNHLVYFLESFQLVPIDVLCFEDSEKVFSQRIIVTVSVSWYKRNNAVFFSQVKIYL